MPTTLANYAASDWLYRDVRPAPAEPTPLAPVTIRAAIVPEEDTTLLSGREHEIMHWVGHGKTNHEIGMILGISQFTVKNHLQRIFRKIDVRNRAQAITRIIALSQPAAMQ